MRKKLKSDPKARFLRRIPQPILALLVLVTFSIATPITGWANSVTFLGAVSGGGTPCPSTDCCMEFQITVTQSTEWMEIQLAPWLHNASDACISQLCWSNQSKTNLDPNGPYTLSHGDPWRYIIHFPSGSRGQTGAFPFTFNVYICGTNACWRNFPEFTWQSTAPSGSSNGSGTRQSLALCLSEETWNQCDESGCCQVEAYNVDRCWMDVCFFNNMSSSLGCFTIHLSPSPFNGAGAWCTPNCSGGGRNGGFLMDSPGFSPTLNYPSAGDITFCTNPIGGYLDPCHSFCFTFPYCENWAPPGNFGATVVDPPPCNGSGSGTVPLKASDGSNEDAPIITFAVQPSSFPNPMDAKSGFKTSIPFDASTKGTAVLKVVDEKGTEVFSSSQTLDKTGRHFFYLDATSFASGRYFYRIECPEGEVLIKRAILIVK